MTTQHLTEAYTQTVVGAFTGELPSSVAESLVANPATKFTPFQYMCDIQDFLEDYRDLSSGGLPSLDVPGRSPEIVRFTLSAAGGEVVGARPEHTFKRYDNLYYSGCSDAEWNFIVALDEDPALVRAIVWHDNEGVPVFLQKGLGEKTALSLVPLGVKRPAECVTYPPGWLFYLKLKGISPKPEFQARRFGSLLRTLEPSAETVVAQNIKAVTAVRPMRMTAFAPETRNGRQLAKEFLGLDNGEKLHTLATFRALAVRHCQI